MAGKFGGPGGLCGGTTVQVWRRGSGSLRKSENLAVSDRASERASEESGRGRSPFEIFGSLYSDTVSDDGQMLRGRRRWKIFKFRDRLDPGRGVMWAHITPAETG